MFKFFIILSSFILRQKCHSSEITNITPPCGGYYGEILEKIRSYIYYFVKVQIVITILTTTPQSTTSRIVNQSVNGPAGQHLTSEYINLLRSTTVRCGHFSYNFNASSPFYGHCYLSYDCSDPQPAPGNWVSAPKVRKHHLYIMTMTNVQICKEHRVGENRTYYYSPYAARINAEDTDIA